MATQQRSQGIQKSRTLGENVGEILQAAITILSVSVAIAALLFPLKDSLHLFPAWPLAFRPISAISGLTFLFGLLTWWSTFMSFLEIVREYDLSWHFVVLPVSLLGSLFWASVLLLIIHLSIVGLFVFSSS